MTILKTHDFTICDNCLKKLCSSLKDFQIGFFNYNILFMLRSYFSRLREHANATLLEGIEKKSISCSCRPTWFVQIQLYLCTLYRLRLTGFYRMLRRMRVMGRVCKGFFIAATIFNSMSAWLTPMLVPTAHTRALQARVEDLRNWITRVHCFHL